MRQLHFPGNWRPAWVVLLILAGSIGGLLLAVPPPVPAQLTNEEFWKLSSSLSEVDGSFRSDNLLSNELGFQYVIPELLRTAQQGRVYMGVGPEQNFTYIAALKPSMAFIVDIRHGNLDVHLLYKALFELSANRSEFVSKLFSRKPMTGFTPQTTGRELFAAYSQAEASQELYDANLKAILDHLKTKRGFPLSAGDVDGITWAYANYYRFGPAISYNSSSSSGIAPAIVGMQGTIGGRRGGGNFTNYSDLMMADDGTGRERSFLANDENFMVLKNLETRNLLVPVVGDFGGPKAIREVGKYLKSVNAMVSAFYLSNVEQYLSQDGKTAAFLASVSTLPIDETSRFIRSASNQGFNGGGGNLGSGLGYMLRESQPYADPR
jgi:hypothetical protein